MHGARVAETSRNNQPFFPRAYHAVIFIYIRSEYFTTGRFNHVDPAREIPGRSDDATQRTNDAPGHPNDAALNNPVHARDTRNTDKIIFIMPVTMVTRQSPTSGPPVFTLLEPPRPTSHQSQDLAVSENTKDCSRYELNDGVGCGQQSRTCLIAFTNTQSTVTLPPLK